MFILSAAKDLVRLKKWKSEFEGEMAWFVPIIQDRKSSEAADLIEDVSLSIDSVPISFSSIKVMYMKGEIKDVSRFFLFK